MHQSDMILQYMLRLEQFQTNPTTETQNLPMQAQNMHLQFDFRRQTVGTKLADEGIPMILLVRPQIFFVPQDIPARTEQMTIRMCESYVGDDFAFTLEFLPAYFATVFRMVIDQMFGQALSIFEDTRAGFATGE